MNETEQNNDNARAWDLRNRLCGIVDQMQRAIAGRPIPDVGRIDVARCALVSVLTRIEKDPTLRYEEMLEFASHATSAIFRSFSDASPEFTSAIDSEPFNRELHELHKLLKKGQNSEQAIASRPAPGAKESS